MTWIREASGDLFGVGFAKAFTLVLGELWDLWGCLKSVLLEDIFRWWICWLGKCLWTCFPLCLPVEGYFWLTAQPSKGSYIVYGVGQASTANLSFHWIVWKEFLKLLFEKETSNKTLEVGWQLIDSLVFVSPF